MQDFPTFLQGRGLTLPDYQKLSLEKQQYLKETWQIEEGGSQAKRYGIVEGREPRPRATSTSNSMSLVWLCLVVAAVGAGIWLLVLLMRGAKNQIQAGSDTMGTPASQNRTG